MSARAIDASTVVLAIETSCDETAAAVVMGGNDVLASVVSSQIDVHARFGGVVPEVASRAHLEAIVPVVRRAISESGVEAARIDAVAATAGPGLIGALLVGVSAAKGLALAWDRPFIGVNHLEAHLYAGLLDHPGLQLPAVVLLVSGGHTMLVHMRGPGDYVILGRTVDDAAGEAYDKVARWLGLGYPGGPAIDRLAADGDPDAVAFPRAMMHDGLDFSFSGLKTAVVNHVRRNPGMSNADVAASFQAAVVDVLCAKTLRAASETGVRAVVLGGGVAANSLLRSEMTRRGGEAGVTVALPSREMCTDNAAMIASAAWHRLAADGPMGLDCGAWPNLRLNDVPRAATGVRA
ncbi:MAG: tRNA (adenosine(37)-N6)-threonylcarbamoyltransferase complex transferase subunit TsaD [Acidimicrobiales bacterium]